MPHYIDHALVALGIMAVIIALLSNPVAGAAAGIAFYAGREYTQFEIGKKWHIPQYQKFDWPGLIAPIVACIAATLFFLNS